MKIEIQLLVWWLLLANEAIWAGRGRTHGRCNVWGRDGRLVATYTQDNLVRAFADDMTADDALVGAGRNQLHRRALLPVAERIKHSREFRGVHLDVISEFLARLFL